MSGTFFFMPKLTQTQIKEKADEWARLQQQIEKLAAKYNAALEPTLTRQQNELLELTNSHLEEQAPIAKKHVPKLEKLQAEADAIETEVTGWLEANGKPIVLAGELAEAAYKVGTKIGNRVVDKPKLIELCKQKGVDVWNCVDVILKKAETLLGKKEIDEISAKDEIETKTVYLKFKD